MNVCTMPGCQTSAGCQCGTGPAVVATTYNFLQAAKKHIGWCEQQGIEHAWESGPTLAMNPPIQTRRCKNCGKEQRLYPQQWQD